jgi:ABC-type dipeptide/oligopeptide/nickel transport system permease component
MALLAIIDYGFIVAFFIGLALLLLVMVTPHSQGDTVSKAPGSVQSDVPAYGLLAALLVLLILLTFLTRKEQSSLNSP